MYKTNVGNKRYKTKGKQKLKKKNEVLANAYEQTKGRSIRLMYETNVRNKGKQWKLKKGYAKRQDKVAKHKTKVQNQVQN